MLRDEPPSPEQIAALRAIPRRETIAYGGTSAACDLCILISKLLLGSSEVLRVETSISLTTCFDVALRNVEEAKRPLKNRPLWVANPSPWGTFIRKHPPVYPGAQGDLK